MDDRSANDPQNEPAWVAPFLAALRAGKCVEAASREAGVTNSTPYHRRRTNDAFRAQWDAIAVRDGRKVAKTGPRAPRGSAKIDRFIEELAVTTSSYGTPIPRQHGRMRVAGSIIWATDLVEHKTKAGGGKGKPSTTTYSYTASFAVALSSRPLVSVGRIWADGNLLRGAAGDLKSAGTLRLHGGEGDQPPDPLIAAAEGVGGCPAFRGIAYAVFEDLDLSDFGNRIPALTFEVDAGDVVITAADIVAPVVPGSDAAVPLAGLAGLSCEGPVSETLAMLDPVFPMDCNAAEQLTIAPERLQSQAILLPEAAVASEAGRFGGLRGFSRKRAPEAIQPPGALRYYDPARDYQPGIQRTPGRPLPGEPRTLELPATLEAASARALLAGSVRRTSWARESLAWRVAELDPAIAPGATVIVPGEAGVWRVREWEWGSEGVELNLLRLPPGFDGVDPGTDPGRANLPPDLMTTPTWLAAFELPWDGNGAGNAPAIYAAVSSSGAGWGGAALFAEQADGSLEPLGPSGRNRATVGTALTALPAASPLLFDRQSSIDVELIDPAMALDPATPELLAAGGNRALIGGEMVQFARAVAIGAGRWRLSGFFRGRGGTEAAAGTHLAGENFVLLDTAPQALDASAIGLAPNVQIAALGLGEIEPVAAPIRNSGSTLRPLAPVHPRARALADGAVELSWTRRARGAWRWLEGVEAPLGESREAWEVSFGEEASPIVRWELAQPTLTVEATVLDDLVAQAPLGRFRVRQRGDFALSDALAIPLPG